MSNMIFIFKIYITLLHGVNLGNHVLLYDWYIILCCIFKEKTLYRHCTLTRWNVGMLANIDVGNMKICVGNMKICVGNMKMCVGT